MTGAFESPEFRLVAACCRPRALDDFDAIVRKCAGRPFDADLLLKTARSHRVEGFVEDGLNRAGISLSKATQNLLAARAARARQQMLRNAAEEVRVARAFRAAAIDPVFVKGATLAMLAHGTLALKTSWDIDMLIAPDRIGQARALLIEAGYTLDLPGIDDPSLVDVFVARNKETVWLNEARGTALELHSALVDFRAMLPGLTSAPPLQSVPLNAGEALTTLAPPELFAYLCVHGTSHRWERLKWLTDVAALAARGDQEAMLDTAHRLGAGRSAAAALRLCSDIFDMPTATAPPLSSRAVNRIVASSRAALATGAEIDHDSMAGFNDALKKQIIKLRMVAGLSAKLSALDTLLTSSSTVERLRIPHAMLRLHAVIWFPYRLLIRKWRRRHRVGGKLASTP